MRATAPLTGSAAPLTQRVVVVAAHDPLVGPIRPLEHRDDVARGDELPVELELEADLRGAGAQVVREGQRPSPALGGDRALEGLQEGPGVRVGDRHHGDLRERLRVLPVQPLRVRGGPDTGRQRIARVERHVRHRSALRAPLVAPRPLRVDVALEVAVVPRVGVDEAAHRPVLGRDLGLDPPPGAAVAGDHDLALHVDAAALQLLVVLRHAVVDVDERARHVAIHRVRVVDGKLLRDLAGRRVLLERRLREHGAEPRGLDHLEEPRLRGREEDVELLDARLVAPRTELGRRELRDVLPVVRAQLVGPRGHPPHPLPQVVGPEPPVEARLEVPLEGRGLRREAEEGLVRFGGAHHRREGGRREDAGEEHTGTAHRVLLIE